MIWNINNFFIWIGFFREKYVLRKSTNDFNFIFSQRFLIFWNLLRRSLNLLTNPWPKYFLIVLWLLFILQSNIKWIFFRLLFSLKEVNFLFIFIFGFAFSKRFEFLFKKRSLNLRIDDSLRNILCKWVKFSLLLHNK